MGNGRKLVTRAVLKLPIRTGGRVFHGNEVIPEERVDPPVVVELEDDAAVGLGDVEGLVLEEGPYELAYKSDWTSMAIAKPSLSSFQTSSQSMAFNVHTNRH